MRTIRYDPFNPNGGFNKEDLHPDFSIPQAEYGGHDASGESYIVRNDSLNLCINANLFGWNRFLENTDLFY
jgi:hypothetical protein